MPIEFSTKMTPANHPVELPFKEKILKYVVGVSGFDFQFKKGDHQIKLFSLDLTVNQLGSSLMVTPSARLFDGDTSKVDPALSTVTVGAIAVTGSKIDLAALENLDAIPDGQQSKESIPLPGSGTDLSVAFLSGFELSYNHYHYVETLELAVGAQPMGDNAFLTSVAKMMDDNNNEATKKTVNGGFVATAAGSNLLQVDTQSVSLPQAPVGSRPDGTETVTKRVPAGTKVPTDYVTFVQRLSFDFTKDKHVRRISAGNSEFVEAANGQIDFKTQMALNSSGTFAAAEVDTVIFSRPGDPVKIAK